MRRRRRLGRHSARTLSHSEQLVHDQSSEGYSRASRDLALHEEPALRCGCCGCWKQGIADATAPQTYIQIQNLQSAWRGLRCWEIITATSLLKLCRCSSPTHLPPSVASQLLLKHAWVEDVSMGVSERWARCDYNSGAIYKINFDAMPQHLHADHATPIFHTNCPILFNETAELDTM